MIATEASRLNTYRSTFCHEPVCLKATHLFLRHGRGARRRVYADRNGRRDCISAMPGASASGRCNSPHCPTWPMTGNFPAFS
jgi:hypothetical protein